MTRSTVRLVPDSRAVDALLVMAHAQRWTIPTFAHMSDEPVEIKLDGSGGMVIGAMEQHLRDKLKSRGLSSVTVKAVLKAGKPTIEFSGPEEDVKKARKYLQK